MKKNMRKKISFGLLALMIISLLIGSIACAGSEKGPYDDMSGVDNSLVIPQTTPVATMTHSPVPTIIATQPAATSPPIVISPESNGGVYYDIAVTTDRMVTSREV